MSKRRNIRKIVIAVIIALLSAILLFFLGTFIFHSVKSGEEIALLKEKGYYDPVSVGEYSLNVAKFGNENGKHTIVGLAGLGTADYSVTARQMTACLEEENYVVFVDRAGYGFSDDTDNEMTLEYIVEDYRKALSNAGIQPPYVLMPHSIGGAYANYWASNYPEEIEGIVFVDGSQLSADAFEEEPVTSVNAGDRILAFLAKCGFSRYVLREYQYLYPDNFSEEEQYLGDALTYLTLDSIAHVSESCLLAQNAQEAFNGIVTNDIPKLYICASWGVQTKEDIIETNRWINRQIEKNNLGFEQRTLDYDDETVNEILANYEKARQETIYPYAEKMGSCEVVCLAGDHMIYQQRPQECGEIVKTFVDGLEN